MNDKPENIKGVHPSHPHIIAYGKEKESIAHYCVSLERHMIHVSGCVYNVTINKDVHANALHIYLYFHRFPLISRSWKRLIFSLNFTKSFTFITIQISKT